jgi:hypothetical protein
MLLLQLILSGLTLNKRFYSGLFDCRFSFLNFLLLLVALSPESACASTFVIASNLTTPLAINKDNGFDSSFELDGGGGDSDGDFLRILRISFFSYFLFIFLKSLLNLRQDQCILFFNSEQIARDGPGFDLFLHCRQEEVAWIAHHVVCFFICDNIISSLNYSIFRQYSGEVPRVYHNAFFVLKLV